MEENIISEWVSEYTEDESAPWNGMDLNVYASYLIVKYFSIASLRFPHSDDDDADVCYCVEWAMAK